MITAIIMISSLLFAQSSVNLGQRFKERRVNTGLVCPISGEIYLSDRPSFNEDGEIIWGSMDLWLLVVFMSLSGSFWISGILIEHEPELGCQGRHQSDILGLTKERMKKSKQGDN